MITGLKRLRSKLDAYAIEQAFKSLAWVGGLHPRARPETHGVEVLRDVPYRDTTLAEHRLDVYRPADRSGPLPVVLYLHGGAFSILSKETHWLMALAFARRGYVVFNANYRLAPANKYPAAIEDACRAYAWVARNAELYGGDPARMVLAGESAGGNLVSALAVASSWRRSEPWARAVFDANVAPRAVLPACPILQVTDCARFARRRPIPGWLASQIERVGRSYVGGVSPTCETFFDLADPLLAIERGHAPERPLPPFFVSVGTRDPLLDDTRRLEVALRKHGTPCRAIYYPGEIHAFHALIWRSNARAYWREAFAFLREHLEGTAPRARGTEQLARA